MKKFLALSVLVLGALLVAACNVGGGSSSNAPTDVKVVAGDVYREGISDISGADISFADRMGYRIKLLAICESFDDGSVMPMAVRWAPGIGLGVRWRVLM